MSGGLWRDVWTTWRGHPARMLPVAVALWAGLAALSLLSCGWRALGREVERLERGLGAGDAAAVIHGDGLEGWKLDRMAAELARVARVGGVAGEGSVLGMAGDFAVTRDWIWSPRPPDRLDLHEGKRVAWVAKKTGCVPGQAVEVDGETWCVAGIYDAGGQAPPGVAADAVWVPATTLEEIRPEAGRIGMVLVRAEAGVKPETARRRADAALRRFVETDPEWITPDLLAGRLRTWRRTLAVALGGGAGLCLLMAMLGMVSLQLMGVRERIPEIGLRRALGARPGEVAVLFVAEAILLALLSGAASILTVWMAGIWISGRIPLVLHPTWTDLLVPFSLVLPIILAASLLPACAAARLDPAEALRAD